MVIAAFAPCLFSSPVCTARFLPPLNASFLTKPFSNRPFTRPSTLFAYGVHSHATPISSFTTSEESSPGISGHVVKDPEEASAIEEPSLDEDVQQSELLDKLPLKLGPEESYAILLYGTGSFVALWFSSIIVGALDSIPVV